MLVRPVQVTAACTVTRLPTYTGSSKVIESSTTVTTRWRACRDAQTPPAVSASFMSVPPCTLPRGLASSGSMTWASVSSSCVVVQDLHGPIEHRVGAARHERGVGVDHLVGLDTH